jgi:hypothetical protein
MRRSTTLVLVATAAVVGLVWAGCAPAPQDAEIDEPAEQETPPTVGVPEPQTWEEWVSKQDRPPVRLEDLDRTIPVTVRIEEGLELEISPVRLRPDSAMPAGRQKYLQGQLGVDPAFFGEREGMTQDSLTDARVYLKVDGRPVGLAYWPAHEGKLIRVHVDVIKDAAGERRVIVLGDYARIVSRSALFEQAKTCCETAPTVCGVNPYCP